MAGYRPLALIVASGFLAGCGENVDLLYYPEGQDRREARVVRNLPSLQACERRAREIADELDETRRARAAFECGLGAHDHPNFGRRYEERVAAALDIEGGARDASPPDPQRRLAFTGAAFADDGDVPQAATGPWQVQVASFRTPVEAREHARDFAVRHDDLVGDRAVRVFTADLGDDGVYHRVRLDGFADRDVALRLCADLRSTGEDCYVARETPGG